MGGVAELADNEGTEAEVLGGVEGNAEEDDAMATDEPLSAAGSIKGSL